MAKITLKGNPVNTVGELPKVGSPAPEFKLVNTSLEDVTLGGFKGKRVVLNIFPSIDTPVCQASTRAFNQKVSKADAVVLCVSMDLPFAHKRFCGAEGIDKVHALSDFRASGFGKAYGVTMNDGPLKGLFSRAVVVIDGAGKVVHTEQVPEIAQEPNYEAALKALK